jgi:hypothetical protein
VSYIPFRDNPDLAGISEQVAAELEVLSEQIDESSAIGNHQDACGCDNPKCDNLLDNLACHQAQSSEVVGWLFAKGWLAAPEETISSVPDPAREQLRGEIEKAAGPWILTCGVTLDQKNTTAAGIARAVMPVVDELLARSRCMREAAEQMAVNVESLTADLVKERDQRLRHQQRAAFLDGEVTRLRCSIGGLIDDRDEARKLAAELTKPVAPEPKVCKCCEAAADETGFKRGGCAGSPTFPYGCGHSYRSHFAAYLDEIRAVSALNAARAEAEVSGE